MNDQTGAMASHAERPSRVTTKVDFSADGKQHGNLNVPHSSNESAWGAVRVPVTVVKNGLGPTILCTGGNHGDEYEGPIALMNLARSLLPEEIAGRVIIVPSLNLPAVQAGTRVSPIDGINMNRAFPGRRDGTVSAMIADYVTTAILPLADAVVDIHSGGKTLNFLPFAAIHRLPNRNLMEQAMAAMLAFGAPLGLVMLELDSEGMLDTTVEEMGKVFVCTELGGGGTATAETVAIAETGVRNVLRHFRVMDGEPATREARGLPATRLMEMTDGDCFVISEGAGIYEPLADLGAEVAAGDPVGRIHTIERPQQAPILHRAGRSGTVIGRHFPGLARPGDCLAVLAIDYR